jgi:hypothetical protein
VLNLGIVPIAKKKRQRSVAASPDQLRGWSCSRF